MGLTRQYLRYVPSSVLGLVGCRRANLLMLEIRGVHGKFCAVGACENVIVWDIRTGEKFATFPGDKHEVSRLARSANKNHLAIGYCDGTIKIIDLRDRELVVSFSGHKSEVTALQFDHQGLRLVSGAKDTDVIVWDVVNESGLYRMKGHKGAITQAAFLKDRNLLITSSKDTFVKFWDLDTQHCFKTIVGHRSEVYDFVLLNKESRLVTGSADSELRVWDINYLDEPSSSVDQPSGKKSRVDDSEEEEGDNTILTCKSVGSIMRHGRERLVSMTTDAAKRYLVCHGNEKVLEIFSLPTDEELKKHLAKRQKKIRKKLRDTSEEAGDIAGELTINDQIRKISSIKLSSKLCTCDVLIEKDDMCKLVCLLNNNMIEVHSLDCSDKGSQRTLVSRVSSDGHRTDVRTVSFSSDNTAILSGSGDSIKIWNRASLQCIRTVPCDYALCSLFAPGDRHVVIGTKSGHLQVVDIAAGMVLETIPAHSGAVWAISMAPDKRGIASGSADKTVKFWNFELISDEASTSKRLTLEHNKTLKMDEDVLCVKYSPDQRLLAISLLDNTVKVFFADTLKFFLSLYGHKLPVLCLDISADSTLLITGSADRNVKIWGLDFGDCHKSIFAHDDSIMCVQFVSKTHLFFTGGKDKKLKQWDADNFEHINTLEGHHAEIWCIAVNSSGNYVVTASHDKSLRVWEKTHEMLILDEEREMLREKENEEVGSGETVVPGETTTEVAMAGKKTMETIKGAERLMEAIEVYKEERAKLDAHQAECRQLRKELPPPSMNPLLAAFGASSPERYVLEIIKKIKSSELEESLLVLPFTYIIDVLRLLNTFIDAGWEVELSCRCLHFILRIHHGQITSNHVLLPVLDQLRNNAGDKVNKIRDCVGFNLAGLQFIQRQLEQKEEVTFFTDATDRFREKKKKQKKKAILTIKS